MGKGFAKRKKQAKLVQDKFSQLQEQMKQIEVTGTAGNGMVAITLNGENEMQKIQIDPKCVDPEDVEGLEDLILTAYRDANKKLQEKSPMSKPGLPTGFGGLFH